MKERRSARQRARLPPAVFDWGENRLTITLTTSDPQAPENLVLDEVEVWVQPR